MVKEERQKAAKEAARSSKRSGKKLRQKNAGKKIKKFEHLLDGAQF